MVHLSVSLSLIAAYLGVVAAFPGNVTLNAPRKIGRRCTGAIASLSDVAAAEKCTTIVVCTYSFLTCTTFLTLSSLSFILLRLVASQFLQEVRCSDVISYVVGLLTNVHARDLRLGTARRRVCHTDRTNHICLQGKDYQFTPRVSLPCLPRSYLYEL